MHPKGRLVLCNQRFEIGGERYVQRVALAPGPHATRAPASILGCWKAELLHRTALETLRFESVDYEGWD